MFLSNGLFLDPLVKYAFETQMAALYFVRIYKI